MAPRTGRPPKGDVALRQLSTFLLRLTPERKCELLAAADVLGRPAYEVAGRAIATYIARLPELQRRTVRQAVLRWRREQKKAK